MTESAMIKNIRERMKTEYGIEVKKDIIKKIINIEADEVYMLVAQNDSYKFLWGTIYGISKPPKKVAGKFSEIRSVKKNYGYSSWKNGYPQVKWSQVMNFYDIRPPEDYFELPEHRYTTAARTFRKDAGLPEIPEFENFSEEKIQELCKRADELEIEKLPAQARANKKRDDRENHIRNLAIHDYWRKTNYIPMGAILPDWDGEQRDTVDDYLKRRLPTLDNPVDKLEAIMFTKDLAEWKDELEDHPELDELEQQFRKEVEEAGLEPIDHVKTVFREIGACKLTYLGEKDPWGPISKSSIPVFAKMRKERLERETQQLLDEINSGNKTTQEDK